MAIRREVLGPDHERVGDSLTSLGDLHMLQGRAHLAQDEYRQAHEIFIAALGADHAATKKAERLLAGSRGSTPVPANEEAFD